MKVLSCHEGQGRVQRIMYRGDWMTMLGSDKRKRSKSKEQVVEMESTYKTPTKACATMDDEN